MTYPIHPEPPFWAAQIGQTIKHPLWQNNFVQYRRLTVFFSIEEYELDKFNTPHTGTTLRHPQNWLCRLRCRISLRHLATSPLGNIFRRHSRFSPKQPEPQTHGDFNVSLLKQQTRLLLHYGEHISLACPTIRAAFSTLS